MKKIYAFFLAVLPLIAACTAESLPEAPGAPKSEGPQFSVTLESVTSKTTLKSDFKVEWVANDAISIFDGVGNRKYVTEMAGPKAIFSCVEGGTAVKDTTEYFALYPYNSTASIENNVIRTYIPNKQNGVKDGFDPNAALMVAKSGDTHFQMKNAVALLRVEIPADVTAVMIGNNDGLPMAGNVEIAIGEDGIPSAIDAEDNNILLLPPFRDTTFEAGVYFVAAAPGAYNSGISVTMSKKGESNLWNANGSSECLVKRSKVMNLGDLAAKTTEVEMTKVSLHFSDGAVWSNPFSYPASFSSSEGSANYIGENIFYAKSAYYSFQYASYGQRGYTQNQSGGFRFGRDAGDYFEIPAINGCKLVAVHAYLGAGGAIYHAVTDRQGVVANGGSPYRSNWSCDTEDVENKKPAEHIWYQIIDAQPGTNYRITAQEGNTRWFAARDFDFYYSGTPTPTIAYVKTEKSVSGAVATLNGSFEMYNGDETDVTCGFEYKLKTATEWTSVQCDEAELEFSKELSLPVGDYDCRAWVQTGSTKVYGAVGSVSVFSGVYVDVVMGPVPNKTGAVIYQNSGMFPSNGQATTHETYRNDKRIIEYDFKTGYTFRLWANQGISRSTGTVDNVSTIFGLRFNPYNSSTPYGNTSDSKGWIQFPAMSGLKLKQVTFKIRSASTRFKWDIVDKITPDNAENPTNWTKASDATVLGKFTFASDVLEETVTLSNPAAGVGYYAIINGNSYNVDMTEMHLVYAQ